MLWIVAIVAGLWVLDRAVAPNAATGQRFVSPYQAQNTARPPIFTIAPTATMQPEAGVAAQKIGLAVQYNALPAQYQVPIAQPNQRAVISPDEVTFPMLETGRMMPPGAAMGTDVPVQQPAYVAPIDYSYNLIYGLPISPAVANIGTARLDPSGAVTVQDLAGKVQWDWPTFGGNQT